MTCTRPQRKAPRLRIEPGTSGTGVNHCTLAPVRYPFKCEPEIRMRESPIHMPPTSIVIRVSAINLIISFIQGFIFTYLEEIYVWLSISASYKLTGGGPSLTFLRDIPCEFTLRRRWQNKY